MKTCCLWVLVMLGILSAKAQMVEPVKWSYQSEVNSQELVVTFKASIDEGFHLYAMDIADGGPQKTEFIYETMHGLQPKGPVKLVSGESIIHEDANFGMKLGYYEKEATFEQRFELSASDYMLQGYVLFMSCNDEQCTPPTRFEFHVKGGNPQPAATTAAAGSVDSLVAEASGTATSESNGMTGAIWRPMQAELQAYSHGGADATSSTAHSGWYILLMGFLAGFVALVTPCVWPMIPMTVSFFLKRTKDRKKSIRDAYTYGISIIVIYVGLGLLVTTLFGASALNSLATNALFNILFFLLLVLFACSFFGAFELVLPSSWTSKMDAKADATTGLLSIFFMAFTLCLVSFSCTGPIIGTLLVEAAVSGSLFYPAIGMFGFALALSLPFTLFALFPSMLKSLPKSGGWLNSVKVVLGFCELALALKFLSVADLAYGWHLLDRETFLSLWIVIFLFLGLYLLRFIRLPHDDDPQPADRVSVFRLMLALLSIAFAVYMVPGLWGAPCKAISAFAPPMNTQDFQLGEQQLTTYHDYEEGMAAARRSGKPVLVDFSGYGCVNCRKMEAAVWTHPEVKQLIEENYILIELMVDDKTALERVEVVNEQGKEVKLRTVGDKWSYLQRYKFGANAQPFYVLLDAEGKPLNGAYSYNEDVAAYTSFLREGLTNYKASQR